jgi:hypothetical protein
MRESIAILALVAFVALGLLYTGAISNPTKSIDTTPHASR